MKGFGMREQMRRRLCLLFILLGLVSSLSLRPSMAQVRLTIEAVVLRDANLRLGPGVTYTIIGAAKAGQLITVTADEGAWYQLSSGEWIVKSLVAATTESRVVAFRLEEAPAFANRAANLRSGPGTTFTLVGTVQAGQMLAVVARNPTSDWLQLQSGAWIAAFLVNRVAVGLPVIGEEPPPFPAPTPVATPTAAQNATTSILATPTGN
jgi:N-acetylmuramoyl-L-alanine amidase